MTVAWRRRLTLREAGPERLPADSLCEPRTAEAVRG
jgi:hypothetical protein